MSKLDNKIAQLRKDKVAAQEKLTDILADFPREDASKIQGYVNTIGLKAGAIGELSAVAHLANWSRVENDIDPDND